MSVLNFKMTEECLGDLLNIINNPKVKFVSASKQADMLEIRYTKALDEAEVQMNYTIQMPFTVSET